MNPIVILGGLTGLGALLFLGSRKKAEASPLVFTCPFTEELINEWSKANGISIWASGIPGMVSGTVLALGSVSLNILNWKYGTEHFTKNGIIDQLSTNTYCLWYSGRGSGSPFPSDCQLASDLMIFQANQAILSGNPGFVQAVAETFRSYGCNAEADLILAQPIPGALPVQTVAQTVSFPPPHTLAADEVWLAPGDHFQASALLGAVGCAVPLGTISDKLLDKGFSKVQLWKENPWDVSWQPPDGFLECSRFADVTWSGPPKIEKLPPQVWKIAKV